MSGAIEYILEIQSITEQPFSLQGLNINRGRCGFYTGYFYSKIPVQMNYSSSVSYLLKCLCNQENEKEMITEQGKVNLSF